MRSSKILNLIAIVLAFGLSACAAVQAERQAQEQKQQETRVRMDTAHIWVTTEAPPAGSPTPRSAI